MKHSSSRELFTYWNQLRGHRAAPERADVDPAAIRGALGDSFILALDDGEARFRLAGTRVCALFCRELKGESFTNLWSAQSKPAIADLIRIGAEEEAGSVAGAIGYVTDGQIDLELLLLPLLHHGRPYTRLIGVLAPLKVPYWLGIEAVRELTLGLHRHVGPMVRTPGGFDTISLPQGRARAKFVVHQGGRV